MEKENNIKNNIKVIWPILILFLVGSIIATFFIITNREQSSELTGSIVLNEEDINNSKKNAEDFIKEAGTFGVNIDEVNIDNILDILVVVSQENQGSELFFNSRKNNYGKIKEKIYVESPLNYNIEKINGWTYDEEKLKFSSYRILDINAVVEEKGSKLENGDLTAVANVNFTSKVNTLSKTSNDIDWDGSWELNEKIFENVKLKVILAKSNENWYIYNITMNNYPFLLSTWNNPGSSSYITEQFNLEKIETWAKESSQSS